jgi:hypothetical protein
MKKLQKDLIYFAIGVLVAVAAWSWVNTPRTYDVAIVREAEQPHTTTTPLKAVEQPKDILKPEQRKWLNKLEWCESRGRAYAVNKVDRDGTPSFGLLQFKPDTFTYFAKEYKIAGKLMDPKAQRSIVEQMIIRGGIDWHQQFPDCTRKLGTPPR